MGASIVHSSEGICQSLGFHGQRDDGDCGDVEISDGFLVNGGS